ncbi:MAG: hypothetical protein ACRDPO_39330, partial [Streptosporangiaceae bacterium]
MAGGPQPGVERQVLALDPVGLRVVVVRRVGRPPEQDQLKPLKSHRCFPHAGAYSLILDPAPAAPRGQRPASICPVSTRRR